MPDILTVTKDTVVQASTLLSPNMTLANFTTGMANGVNSFAPVMTQTLIDASDPRVGPLIDQGVRFLLNDYKIAANLQTLSNEVVEPLLRNFGSDLTVYTAYLNPLMQTAIGDPLNKHFTGEAINIFLRSEQGNMFRQAQNILSMIQGKFTHAFLNFNHGSWMQIITNGPFSFVRDSVANPVLGTFDWATGKMAGGMFPMRGMVKNPWYQPEFAPYRRLFDNDKRSY